MEQLKDVISKQHPSINIKTHGRRWDIYVSLTWEGLTSEGRSSCLTGGIGTLPKNEEYERATTEAINQARDILYWKVKDVYGAVLEVKNSTPVVEGE